MKYFDFIFKYWKISLAFLMVLCLVGIVYSSQINGVKQMAKTKKQSSGTTASSINPRVILETSLGNIEIELFSNKAPITVKNFLQYVDRNFYTNTIFHRVIPGFMIQGGGFEKNMAQKKTMSSIKNEAGNGLSNLRGTIAMARTQVVDSATAQFFINMVDNNYLDHRDNTSDGFGYCVFGQVTKGMDVADKIANVPTTTVSYYQNVPVENVIILAVKRIK